ncbi:LysR family transcriptional regulator [Lampropedia aestuarii]|uniref:LysR family transcriptional regulator n=1 Tax=Lampropedia aestuarii TaxID=2562762 RepID=A0A4S5BU39_9BURK|nr:LysR family transcriptional regulator [Lampropedia aestuarii]THJ33458.1 LysR family transcriptional regulator [Lampropedia aestuarii]
MKTHLLRYFVALAEEKHFGRAAQRLFITQPPLSMALKALEAELGVSLLERDAKHVRLTPAGQAFLVEARKVLAQLQHASEVVRNVAQGKLGGLKIGITGSMIYRGVPGYCTAFRQDHPLVDISLHEVSTGDQLRMLARGELDLGFLNISSPTEALDILPLGEEPLVCCLPSTHRLAGHKTINLQDLAGETFVMFAREVSPATYDNVIACLQQAGIHPQTRHAAMQWLTVMALVSVGQGVSLVPACMAQLGMNGVRLLPLRKIKAATPAYMAWRKDVHDNAVRDAFIASIRATVQRV